MIESLAPAREAPAGGANGVGNIRPNKPGARLGAGVEVGATGFDAARRGNGVVDRDGRSAASPSGTDSSTNERPRSSGVGRATGLALRRISGISEGPTKGGKSLAVAGPADAGVGVLDRRGAVGLFNPGIASTERPADPEAGIDSTTGDNSLLAVAVACDGAGDGGSNGRASS
ncbi:hypothetical protein [Singulisphaera sp. GP187]|uniref:hypothetical protein n=1 Tax=Singulisphaera sp. GP187 TaxID=1882752 RepID=UPI00116142AB|nr:hypothetical protein [Singulisphaera sp. GP187]